MTELENIQITDTEQKILDAAKSVFTRKGLDGARMQEIADEAGINKALLHYYYRSKEKLFEAIFKTAFHKFVPNALKTIINENTTIFQKIELFVEFYIDMLLKHPYIPMFVLHELSKNPERLKQIVNVIKPDFTVIEKQLKKEIDDGKIIPIELNQLLVNIISMCVMPFAGRPLLETIIFKGDKKAYLKFLESRKQEVAKFVINSISVK